MRISTVHSDHAYQTSKGKQAKYDLNVIAYYVKQFI